MSDEFKQKTGYRRLDHPDMEPGEEWVRNAVRMKLPSGVSSDTTKLEEGERAGKTAFDINNNVIIPNGVMVIKAFAVFMKVKK